MKSICFVAILAVSPVWSQMVKPTPGALAPVGTSAPATPTTTAAAPVAPPTPGTITKSNSVAPAAFRRIESDFDASLKMADQKNPLNVLGLTRGLYVPGFGVIFTTELELAQNNFNPLFTKAPTADLKSNLHDAKTRHLQLLRNQMGAMMTNAAKNLSFLGPNDQVVVAVRLYYESWEDKTGLPDQIVMRADKRGVTAGDIKVDVQ